MLYELNDREHATVLAALRHWQSRDAARRDMGEFDIATNGGKLEPLENVEIDKLCERINTTEEPVVVIGLEGGVVQGGSATAGGFNVIVLDYDTEGSDASDGVREVPQLFDGGTAQAFVIDVALETRKPQREFARKIADLVKREGG